jgi:hypothetical protein
VEEEELLQLLQYLLVVMVDLEEGEEQILVQQALEIRHQYHHHKEAMVELDNLADPVQVEVVEVLEEQEEMELLQDHNLLLEMVDLEQYHPSLDHP